MDVQVDDLRNRPLLIAQIVNFETFWSKHTYREALHRIATNGARIAFQMEGHRLVACATWVPLTTYPLMQQYRETVEDLVGVPLEQCVMRSTVHVRPSHKGQGLIRRVEKAVNADAVAHGYTHGVAYGYATESAWRWFSTRPRAVVTDVCPTGGEWPLVFEPIDGQGEGNIGCALARRVGQ